MVHPMASGASRPVVLSPEQLCPVVSGMVAGLSSFMPTSQHSPKFCGLPASLQINFFSAKLNKIGFCLQLRVQVLKLESCGLNPRCPIYVPMSLSKFLSTAQVPQW